MANLKEFIKNLSSSDLSQDEQLNLLSKVEQTIKEQKLKEQAVRRKESMEKNVDYVISALKKIETKLENKLAELNNTPARLGAQGPAGKDGKAGKDGSNGKDGFNGVSGKDGKNGIDGVDGANGVSVVDAKIDFDGSLVVYLSNGSEIDAGQILSPDVAQNIIISSGGSGTSQIVTDTLVSLQTQINTLTGIDGVLGTMAQQDANNVNITGGSITGVTGIGSGTVTSVAASAGTGISITGSPITTSGTLNITNTAPDQVVALTQGGATTITGTYPNFTISSVNTTYSLATSTVLGLIELGSDTVQTTAANAVTATASKTYALQVNAAGQGVINVPWTDTNSGGTVTSVAALTLGTTGTDLSSTVATGTTTPVITLNVPTASATNRGVLSAADWTTFNNKTSNTGTVTSVGGTGTVSGLSLSGTVTTSGNLTLGGTLAVLPSNFASQTANTVLAAPTGVAGVPTFRAIVAADIPTLNQNTTGTAANVTGTVAIGNGGTGATTAATALTALGAYPSTNPSGYTTNTGTVTSIIAGTGLSGGTITTSGTVALANTAVTAGSYTNTNITVDAQGRITSASNGSAGGVTSFSAGSTGLTPSTATTGAITLSGTLAVANGGTGETTRQAAMDALAGAVTSGSYLRGNGTDVVMATIQAGDVPTLNQSTTGSAATLTTGRTIAITGDLAYTSPSFNGSTNVTAAGTLATVNANVGAFTNASVTVNAKGLVTAVSSGTAPVTSVTGTSPVVSSGGATPAISMPAATTSVNGYLTSTDWTTFNGKGSGTVTSVSVVSSNGFAGTVATATTTPAITISTSITGLVKGNGTAISAATVGTDYSVGTSALTTGILKSTTTTGALTIAVAADFPTLNQNTTGTASNVTGTVAISNGGTGQTTANTALNALLPSQTLNTGKVLSTDGTNTSWVASGGLGTVSSVAQTFTGGIVSVSGSPITTAGTLALTVAGTSGGIPYFSSATGWASSAALAASALVIGGGAGVAPSTITTGTGVTTALGVNTGTAGAFVVNGGALGTPSSGTLTNCTFPTLNQNTTGTASNVTGTVAVGNGGTGAATLTGLVVGNGTSAMTTVTAPSGAVVGTTDTQTLTNKRVTLRIGTVASAATITPTADTADQYNVTALATTASFAVPSGTPTNGQKLSIRIYAGTTQTISWVTTAGGYRVIGTTLPLSVPATKTIYVGCIYNAADSFWDVVAVATQA